MKSDLAFFSRAGNVGRVSPGEMSNGDLADRLSSNDHHPQKETASATGRNPEYSPSPPPPFCSPERQHPQP